MRFALKSLPGGALTGVEHLDVPAELFAALLLHQIDVRQPHLDIAAVAQQPAPCALDRRKVLLHRAPVVREGLDQHHLRDGEGVAVLAGDLLQDRERRTTRNVEPFELVGVHSDHHSVSVGAPRARAPGRHG
jgi:hypothetical protein